MEKKADLNVELVEQAGAQALLAVYFEFNHLKQLYRQGWLKHGVPREQCESVAEHVLGVALLAWFYTAEGFQPASREKILHMALVHDLGEVYAGDFTPDDRIEPAEKHRRERAGVEQILGRLAGGAEYLALWEEFEAGETIEARLVRQFDRLEMALQAVVYERQGLARLDDFFSSAREAIHMPELARLLAEAQALRA